MSKKKKECSTVYKHVSTALSYVQMMRFFVLLIVCLLDENPMPHVENRMRYATNSDAVHTMRQCVPVVFHSME